MNRFEVWLVNLDPTIGSEIQKTRPAVIVSPDELNKHLRTVIVVPLTMGKTYPFRVATKVAGKPGVAAVDQIRTVDKQRLVKKVGAVSGKTRQNLLNTLAELFAD
jgi:mRNA interferase MazF